MANHFAKTDVALAGFAAYFSEQSEEERTHAKQMIDYLLKRGGSGSSKPTPSNCALLASELVFLVSLKTIESPHTDSLTPLAAFEKSLESASLAMLYSVVFLTAFFSCLVEEGIYDKLLALHKIAGETNDPNLSDFLEGTFLTEQVAALKSVSDHLTNIRRIGSTDLGVYLYDKQLAGTLNAADVLNGPAPA